MWKLVIEDDEGKRTVVPLSRDDYTFGRQEGNTIRLTERNVSRTHGRIKRTRNGDATPSYVIEDLRSYNGVFVNGLRVAHSQDLQHGDLIQIGDYRIVLEDDTAAAFDTTPIPITTADPSDTKATIPLAPGYRGQTLAERPNRLVMLVGPTPGVEYPLDRERMTVGRAEDTTISVNHNSVSRLHCEIHALGDGRFEIVDKGSSNGVRVNAVELRRSIIEAGDVIELGDVRFKFVGAGQVFVAGPNESQQLTAISDREAELGADERRVGGYLMQALGAVALGALILLGIVYWLSRRAEQERETVASPTTDTEAVLADAKSKCTVDDCERSHTIVAPIADGIPWRDHADVRFITATWADSLLKKARGDTDATSRQATLKRIIDDGKVDSARVKQANELLTNDSAPTATTMDLPNVASAKDAGVAPATSAAKATPTSHTTVTNATTTATPPRVPPSASSNAKSNYDLAREAAANNDPATARQLIEKRVLSGRGTNEEAHLLLKICQAVKDFNCTKEVRDKYGAKAE